MKLDTTYTDIPAGAVVFTDLGWGWVSNNNSFQEALNFDYSWVGGVKSPIGPYHYNPELPYQSRVWFNQPFSHAEETALYTVTVTDAAGCTSSASEYLYVGNEVPAEWAYGNFNTAGNANALAYWSFQEFINNNSLYEGMMLDQPINGCRTEVACDPWPPGEDSNGLTCYGVNGSAHVYSKCGCPMQHEIKVQCKEFPG